MIDDTGSAPDQVNSQHAGEFGSERLDDARLLKLHERVRVGVELGESHFREFKSARESSPSGASKRRIARQICKDIGEALVAFANADGGELFIGVEDDGTISGVTHDDSDVRLMQQAYRTHVHSKTPLPPPAVSMLKLGEHFVLYFRVTKSATQVHLTSDGRCLRRFDRENRPVPPEEIQYARREVESREYDRAFVPNASVRDLDLELLAAVTEQVAPGYSPEKLLQFLDLADFAADGLRLRRAALLLFAVDIVKWHPRCEVRILRVEGTELQAGPHFNVAQDDTIRRNIITILEDTWTLLRPHLARTRFEARGLFRESVIYPEEACREALINAVAHRDYSREGEPIQIAVFDDRLEVRSPGSLLSSVSLVDLKQLKGVHQSRNVFVARVLRELGYMREMGEGLRRIFASMKRADLVEPQLANESERFIVTLVHKSVFSPKDLEWLEGFVTFELSKDEQRVILAGRDGRLLSTADIIDLVGIVDTEDFRALHEKLSRKGLIYSTSKQRPRRRKTPRFKIRAPHETQQYFHELQDAVRAIGPVAEFGKAASTEIAAALSGQSPYRKEPILALQALGYVDGLRRPLPSAKSLWTTVPRERSATKEGRMSGIVVRVGIRGFAFAITPEGDEFFVHSSELLPGYDWSMVQERTVLEFEEGQRQIAGKARPARKIAIKVTEARGTGV